MAAGGHKWTHVNIPLVVSRITDQTGKEHVTTVQTILDQLMPGLVPLLLTFACMWLLRKKVNPLWIIVGFFVIGIAGYACGLLGLYKWTHVNIPLVVSRITDQTGKEHVTTVQTILDQLMPGLVPLLLTFACMWLLRKKVNPLWIIVGFFVIGIAGYACGLLGLCNQCHQG
ncbi:PTS system mannose/fructose/sorbose family transporter subunit IID [Escherichia coli]|uniref:PTS system mannose/fructose/sorbose family transporter subunit IID n=1 Tax=Escherichia coli TaxID=562 RepID=UPI00263233B9|nr:PTS system mannose/fructose/sorbose family transporter subunit IID [Escherichia coli]WKB06174.1 PTS system mannose/fructose/sorbose family transporter subunit IID [Escherichia coli]